MANRLWHFHFGTGLCRTISDFGLIGDHPTRPELLDWLARELIHSDWSLKHVHHFIVTSATYRQVGRPGDVAEPDQRDANFESLADSMEQDANKYWLSRILHRWLEGELIRDAMLTTAGTLNRDMYSEGVRPLLPEGLTSTFLLKGQWKVSPNVADHHRRSVYVLARRNLRYPIFEACDCPDANASCSSRNRSTTSPRSLMLLNSRFSLQMARRTAGRLLVTEEAPEDLIRRAFVLMLGRPPAAVARLPGKSTTPGQR